MKKVLSIFIVFVLLFFSVGSIIADAKGFSSSGSRSSGSSFSSSKSSGSTSKPSSSNSYKSGKSSYKSDTKKIETKKTEANKVTAPKTSTTDTSKEDEKKKDEKKTVDTSKTVNTTKTTTTVPKSTPKTYKVVKPSTTTKSPTNFKPTNTQAHYYNSSSGSFMPYLVGGLGAYLILSGFEDDGEPVYINAETGERIEYDELDDMDITSGSETAPEELQQSAQADTTSDNGDNDWIFIWIIIILLCVIVGGIIMAVTRRN